MKKVMKSEEKLLSISGDLELSSKNATFSSMESVTSLKADGIAKADAFKVGGLSEIQPAMKMNVTGDFKPAMKMNVASEIQPMMKMSFVDDVKSGAIPAKMDFVGNAKMATMDFVGSTKATAMDFAGSTKATAMNFTNEIKPAKMSLSDGFELGEMAFVSDVRPSRKTGDWKEIGVAREMNFLNDFALLSGARSLGSFEKIGMTAGFSLANASFINASSAVKMPSFRQAVKKDSVPVDPKVDEKGEPVIYNNLIILNFPNMEINTFSIKSKVNEHAKLVFTAFIDDEEKEVLRNAMVCTPINVAYLSNKQQLIPFFSGVITNVKVYVEEGHQAVQVTALSNTSSMDTMKNSASCQNTGTTYEALINKVCGRSGAAVTYGIGGDALSASLGAISVQYRETDWEYVCRLASQKNQGLFADMTKSTPAFSIGAQGSERTDVAVITYEMAKDVRNFEIDHANYIQNVNDKDYLIYKVESYNILKIGDKMVLDGRELYVREASYEMKNAIIVGTYVLCPIRGLQQRRMKHTKIQGLSLNGKTTAVERDKVRVQLDIDSESNADYLFPYSTMAASPDGSGWYCMPQEGDLVRVYFPDDDEANAFAISSVSSYTPDGSGSAGGGSDMMSDPSVVYLKSPNDMVLRLAPDGVMINAKDGQGVIMMDTAGNLTISGANSVSISASNDVNIIASKNMSILAGDSLKLSGQGGTISMDSSGNTRVTGQYVLEN